MRSLCFALIALCAIGLGAQGVDLNPVYTAPEGEPLAGLRICVDPGHGGQVWGSARGYTGGTRSAVSDQTESDANLRIGMFLWDLLTQAGADVVMTRTFETRLSDDCLASPETDEYSANRREELNIRVRVAEANDCDVLLSIHHNAFGSSGNNTINHASAFYFQADGEGSENAPVHTPEAEQESSELATAVLRGLHEQLGIETRGPMHGDFHVIRETTLPAVLVECSFMTNPENAQRMENLAYSRLAAIGIFEGILEQYGHAAGEEVSQ